MRNPSYLFAVAVIALSTAFIDAAQAPAPTRDPITRLNEMLARGEATLEYRDGSGYLPSLLEQLDINVDSQTLVFSKTSLQQQLISPKNPRALYFNDVVSVGTVPGGDVYELVAVEPSHGLVFYTLGTKETPSPRLQRRGADCFFCHGMGNKGAPSLVVANVYPNEDGLPAYTSTFIDTIDHRTPFAQRWGGWYVTGTHGAQRHLGNAVASNPLNPLDLDQTNSQNVTSLEGRLDLSKYLTGSSDIVALMTLEHQVGAVNRMNAIMLRYTRLKRSGLTDAAWTELDGDIEDLVRYLVFIDEPLLTDPVKGVSSFAETFPQRGPRDRQGRSLRDFDLQTRTFRYPLSYLVYSELFDSLPAPVSERVYRRLFDVLTGVDKSGTYAALSPADRRAVLEILIDTKPNLPAYWTASATGSVAG
jgi:hypothetical protein